MGSEPLTEHKLRQHLSLRQSPSSGAKLTQGSPEEGAGSCADQPVPPKSISALTHTHTHTQLASLLQERYLGGRVCSQKVRSLWRQPCAPIPALLPNACDSALPCGNSTYPEGSLTHEELTHEMAPKCSAQRPASVTRTVSCDMSPQQECVSCPFCAGCSLRRTWTNSPKSRTHFSSLICLLHRPSSHCVYTRGTYTRDSA